MTALAPSAPASACPAGRRRGRRRRRSSRGDDAALLARAGPRRCGADGPRRAHAFVGPGSRPRCSSERCRPRRPTRRAPRRGRTSCAPRCSRRCRTTCARPLASIKASVSSLLQRRRRLDARGRHAEFLATIDEETDRLNALVGNLLDMSRLADRRARSSRCATVGSTRSSPARSPSLRGHRAGRRRRRAPRRCPGVDRRPGAARAGVANVVANALDHRRRARRCASTPARPAIASTAGRRPRPRHPARGPRRRCSSRSSASATRSGRRPASGSASPWRRGFVEAMGGTLELEDTPGGGLTMVIPARRRRRDPGTLRRRRRAADPARTAAPT